MRIRKTRDTFEEKDIEMIARVSDALAHPVRLKLFRHIMQCNKTMETVCNKDLVAAFDYAQATILRIRGDFLCYKKLDSVRCKSYPVGLR